LTGREIERVESLLRERSAELKRIHLRHRHPDLELRDSPSAEPVDAHAARHAQARSATCADCGSPILPSRLRAVPGTVRCVSCQRQFEVGLA
jgi:RNA polymerase-binding transcription factor DksA